MSLLLLSDGTRICFSQIIKKKTNPNFLNMTSCGSDHSQRPVNWTEGHSLASVGGPRVS